MNNQIVVFEGKKIRRIEYNGEIYFSVVDIIEVLTDSPNPRNYWSMLKKKNEQLYTISVQLKMQAADGKFYKTDCANTEGVFRIMMSVPSPKAEPFKLWLANLGKRELDEIADPELGFERLKEIYKAKGYPDDWIETRLKSIDIRKQLTDEWQQRGVKEGLEYSILTAEIAKATFGVKPTEHAKIKGLEKANLRDHMTDLELVFTMLGEVITKNLAEKDDAQGFEENHEAAQRGGSYAGTARENLEKKENIKVVSGKNYLHLKEQNNIDELPPSK
jgi:DNA-damage-inducible protein D